MTQKRTLAAAVLATLALGVSQARADTIRVQSTTDTVDAGLVDGLLRNAYLAAQPGDTLSYVGVGTGAALTNARNGMADVVITHAPSLEAQFVADGFSLEPFGRAIFFSDYVIVGPAGDPAGVLTHAPHDAVGAFEAIAAAGAAGQATFVSRGENSGTNVQEQTMWGLTGASVPKRTASNAGTATNRFEPSDGTTGPTPGLAPWYRTTGQGQAASLQNTDTCAPDQAAPKCYTLVDRGTFNRLVNSGTVTHLRLVADKNATTARGGENLLINPFSAYIVNPDKFADGAKPNVPAATRFVDFLTSPGFQAAVDGFPNASDPAFRGDAFPRVDGTPPTVGVTGSAVPLDLTFSSRLPGGGVIGGLPVQLQQSLDGTTFTNVGAPVGTDAAGRVSLRPVLSATTTYRVVLPRYRQFSPSVQTLGVVAATAAPTPPATPKDTTRPSVSKATLSARRLSLRISEAGSVKATFKLRVVRRTRAGRRRTEYRVIKSVTLRATRAGSASRVFKALAPGTYHVVLRASDRAGNVKTRTVTLRVKAPKQTPSRGAR